MYLVAKNLNQNTSEISSCFSTVFTLFFCCLVSPSGFSGLKTTQKSTVKVRVFPDFLGTNNFPHGIFQGDKRSPATPERQGGGFGPR